MPSVTGAAIVGGVAAAGSVASSVIGADAAKSAAKTQANAATQASQNQMEMFDTINSQLAPYRDIGASAIPTLQGLTGTGPGGPEDIGKFLESTPGYQFTLQQGTNAVNNMFSAQGLSGQSGALGKGLVDYATGMADNTYEKRLQDYLQLVGIGSSATVAGGNFGMESVGQSNQYLTSAAAAQAAGKVGSANAISQGIGNISMLPIMYSSGMFGAPAAPQSNTGTGSDGFWIPPGVH